MAYRAGGPDLRSTHQAHCALDNKKGVSALKTHLALIGGEEFSPGFEEVHATFLADLDRENRCVVYLPTCAAEDGEEAIVAGCYE